MKGLFLALEGVDGSGKSTQVERLIRSLEAQGRQTLRVHEPGGTPLGEAIREILLGPDLDISPEAELMLFLASRVQLYERVIAPALEEGRVVVSDRYHLSTVVYQGIGRELGEDRVVGLCATVLGDRRPDLSIVIEIPRAECERRLGARRDRIESDGDVLGRVVEGFRSTRGVPGDRIVRIDGTGSLDEVASEVRRAVKEAVDDAL